MLQHTRGIVIRNVKFSDSGIIATIYTEEFGLQAYLIRGVRKTKSKIRAGLFQPLSLLEMVVYHNAKAEIQNIKEVKSSYVFSEIPENIEKSSILLFINEVITKSVREVEPNHSLFSFLYESLILLDQAHKPLNFHLFFLLELTRYLGFYPHNNLNSTDRCFNLQEGEFQNLQPTEKIHLSEQSSKTFNKLLLTDLRDFQNAVITKNERDDILYSLLLFYKLHVPAFGNLKSVEVLKSVFE